MPFMSQPVNSLARSVRRVAVRGVIQRSLTAVSLLAASSQALAFEGSRTQTAGHAPLAAPEINPALIVGAVVLVVGCILIFTSRRRRAAGTTKS
jgi:hypothetical protein